MSSSPHEDCPHGQAQPLGFIWKVPGAWRAGADLPDGGADCESGWCRECERYLWRERGSPDWTSLTSPLDRRGVTTVRDLERCVARVNMMLPAWAPRKGAPCGALAVDTESVSVAGKLVELPLCRTHLRVMRASPKPSTLARRWAL